MPVSVQKKTGSRPYKIVEKNGLTVGTSKTARDAHISAWKRNQAIQHKQHKGH